MLKCVLYWCSETLLEKKKKRNKRKQIQKSQDTSLAVCLPVHIYVPDKKKIQSLVLEETKPQLVVSCTTSCILWQLEFSEA